MVLQYLKPESNRWQSDDSGFLFEIIKEVIDELKIDRIDFL